MNFPRLSLFQWGRDNKAVQVLGDHNCVYIGTGHSRLALEPYSALANRPIRKDIDILSPSREAVELVGREHELAELRHWLTGGGIRVTAICGGGGTGKTRFALELLKGLGKNWEGGFLSEKEAQRFAALENLREWNWNKPTLVVVDYAESIRKDLRAWFSELGLHPQPKHALRILLLERHASEQAGWYKDLTDPSEHGEAALKLFHPRKPRELSKLAGFDDRLAVLSAGLKRLAESSFETSAKARDEHAALAELAAGEEFRSKLMKEQWGDPLFLLMAAVEAAHRGVMAALNLTRTTVAGAIAKRQVVFLAKGVDGPEKRLRLHLAVCANLCGGLSKEQLLEVAAEEAARLHYQPANGVGWLVEQLAVRLGCDPNDNWFLPRYDPDWLAEAFLLEADCNAATVKQMARRNTAAVVQIVRLAAQNFESSDPGHEEHRPLLWLEGLLADEALTYETLLAIESTLEMNTPSTVLRVLWVRLYKRMLGRGETLNGVERARLLNNLSNRLSEVGDREGALASIHEAVELYRKLHGVNPDAFAPDLAMSLNNLSNRQSEVGDREGALASICEAVELYRKLHGANPDTFAPDLASSLNNLSNQQTDVGHREGALASIHEAVDLYRKLHGANPDAFTPNLAWSLTNLSIRQGKVGDWKGALNSIREAVALHRKLYGANPDAFAPHLAMSLHTLANRQSDVGNRKGALASILEAVALYRKLHGGNPDAFAPDLAMALSNLSVFQSDVGDREGALASSRETLALYRRLHSGNPDAFAPKLAKSLSFFGRRLDEDGLKAEALDAAEEALRVLRPDFEKLPKGIRGFEKFTVMDYLRRSKELGIQADRELLAVYDPLFEDEGDETG